RRPGDSPAPRALRQTPVLGRRRRPRWQRRTRDRASFPVRADERDDGREPLGSRSRRGWTWVAHQIVRGGGPQRRDPRRGRCAVPGSDLPGLRSPRAGAGGALFDRDASPAPHHHAPAPHGRRIGGPSYRHGASRRRRPPGRGAFVSTDTAMCGIVGIVNLDPRENVDEALLKRMRDVLRHRGPDGEGLWTEGPVGLGHRRLAIVDVTGGQQPMANEDESCWIVYNGEVYNHGALRPGLEARGHHYRTRSDTETILHLYEEEQERCVERLRGMFAFALWDRARKRLLLARDRLGIKPLYYAATPREILFASEIKAILAAESIRPALNRSILPEFLATRFVAGEETFFRGVRKLLPGRTLTWSANEGLRTRRYWRLTVTEDDAGTELEARAGELRTHLEAAVESHLMSDVPLGLFLSGGLDSSGLAGLMAAMVNEPIRTFAVGFAEREA